jgi:putative glutamine amidotransferase
MRSNKPIIGITLSQAKEVPNRRWPMRKGFDYLKRDYHEAIINSGGIPALFPITKDKKLIKHYIDSIDGLLITGGNDMDPKFFGQKPHHKAKIDPIERDTFDLTSCEYALNAGMPVLGLCRGHQVLNVVYGGTIYQNLSCIPGKTLNHTDPGEAGHSFHKVKIDKKSKLYKIIKREIVEVNSSHHQVVDKIGSGLKVSAFAPDGIIEGLENPGSEFIISVQWHPESIFAREHSRKLFRAFIKSALKK